MMLLVKHTPFQFNGTVVLAFSIVMINFFVICSEKTDGRFAPLLNFQEIKHCCVSTYFWLPVTGANSKKFTA